MKNNKKIFILNFIAIILLYFFSLKNIFLFSDWNYIFWLFNVILYSLIHIIILLIIFYLITINFKKYILNKFLFFIFIPILILNFWYTYNSYPNIEEIWIENKTWNNIDFIIEPVYFFDFEIKENILSNNIYYFKILWGWESQILKNNVIIVKWFSDNKLIYSEQFNVYDFTRWSTYKPIIVIQ